MRRRPPGAPARRYPVAVLSIRHALDRFRADEQARAPEYSAAATEAALESLVMFLESYGYQYVAQDEEGYVDEDDTEFDEDEVPFIEANTADVLPEALTEFLFEWQIRESSSDADEARTTSEVAGRLMDWLAEERLVRVPEALEASAMARRAADEVPRAKRLADLLQPAASEAPRERPSSDDDVAEDFFRIERVEPGVLWLEHDVRPDRRPRGRERHRGRGVVGERRRRSASKARGTSARSATSTRGWPRMPRPPIGSVTAPESADPAFEVVPASKPGRRPIVAHIPHASMRIPPEIRSAILLSDMDLERELVALTDAHTDDLFSWLGHHGATRFVNRRSRLVVDSGATPRPRGRADEALGQGAVYTRTSDGRALRTPDPAAREALIEAFYRPYHDALDAAATDLVEAFGRCTLLDCHSFPTVPLPSELDQAPDRPDICIGRDPLHTPDEARGAPRGRLPRRGTLRRGGPTVRRHDGPRRLLRARYPTALGDRRGPPRPLHGRSDRRAIARLRGDQGAARARGGQLRHPRLSSVAGPDMERPGRRTGVPGHSDDPGGQTADHR